MHKFIVGFSVVLFIACLVLLIKNFVEAFDWITFVVAVLGIINASLSLWTSQLLKKGKRLNTVQLFRAACAVVKEE